MKRHDSDGFEILPPVDLPHPHDTVLKGVDDLAQNMANAGEVLRKIADRQRPLSILPIDILTQAPKVRIPAPAVRIQAPAVPIAAPAVRIPAPAVRIPAPAVRIPAPAVRILDQDDEEDFQKISRNRDKLLPAPQEHRKDPVAQDDDREIVATKKKGDSWWWLLVLFLLLSVALCVVNPYLIPLVVIADVMVVGAAANIYSNYQKLEKPELPRASERKILPSIPQKPVVHQDRINNERIVKSSNRPVVAR